MNRLLPLAALLVSCVTFAASAQTPVAAPVAVEDYSFAVDPVERTVLFTIVYDITPTMGTTPDLQLNIDPDGLMVGTGAFFGGITITPNMRTIACSPTNTCSSSSWPVYANDDPAGARIVGHASVAQVNQIVQVTASWDVLGETDGTFTYAIEHGFPGLNLPTGLFFHGTSNVLHISSVGPDPAYRTNGEWLPIRQKLATTELVPQSTRERLSAMLRP